MEFSYIQLNTFPFLNIGSIWFPIPTLALPGCSAKIVIMIRDVASKPLSAFVFVQPTYQPIIVIWMYLQPLHFAINISFITMLDTTKKAFKNHRHIAELAVKKIIISPSPTFWSFVLSLLKNETGQACS